MPRAQIFTARGGEHVVSLDGHQITNVNAFVLRQSPGKLQLCLAIDVESVDVDADVRFLDEPAPVKAITDDMSDGEVVAVLDDIADVCEGEPNNDAWNLRAIARRLEQRSQELHALRAGR